MNLDHVTRLEERQLRKPKMQRAGWHTAHYQRHHVVIESQVDGFPKRGEHDAAVVTGEVRRPGKACVEGSDHPS